MVVVSNVHHGPCGRIAPSALDGGSGHKLVPELDMDFLPSHFRIPLREVRFAYR